MAKKEEKKAKIPSALKRWRQSEKRRILNKAFRSKTKTAIKAFDAALKESDQNATQERLNTVYSLLDKGIKKGIYKKNMASRLKSRVAARLPKVA